MNDMTAIAGPFLPLVMVAYFWQLFSITCWIIRSIFAKLFFERSSFQRHGLPDPSLQACLIVVATALAQTMEFGLLWMMCDTALGV